MPKCRVELSVPDFIVPGIGVCLLLESTAWTPDRDTNMQTTHTCNETESY